MLKKLLNCDAGLVVSSELTLLVTLTITAISVGIATSRDALVGEMNDVSHMLGGFDQSYNVLGHSAGSHSNNPMGYNDPYYSQPSVTPIDICGRPSQAATGTTESQIP